MKRFYQKISLMILFISAAAVAQEKNIRLNLYGAYAFDDKFDSYYSGGAYYEGTIKGGFQYGGGIDFEAAPGKHVELLYLGQNTTAPVYYYGGSAFDRQADLDVGLHYIMLGATNSFRKPDSKVEGFGGFMLGVGIANVDGSVTTAGGSVSNFSDSTTKFAWGLKAGAIIWGSDKVGIKLQGQLLSLSQSIGGGVYFGTGGGGAGVSSYSSIYQFTLGGGLVFNVGK